MSNLWEDAWWEGYRAYQDYVPRADNPYDFETDEYEAWAAGHQQAGEDD